MIRKPFRILTAMAMFVTMGAPSFLALSSSPMANEVLEETRTKVIVRVHPKTGKPFVSIVPSDISINPSIEKKTTPARRPDYRMLDPKVDAKNIAYDGPISDRRKVYVLAGTLAALGAGAGVLGTLAPATAASGGTAGGAGLYAGGAALTGGGTIAATVAVHAENQPEDFKMSAGAKDKPPPQAP